MPGERRDARLLQRHVVVRIEIVDARTGTPCVEQRAAVCMPMKPAAPVTSTRSATRCRVAVIAARAASSARSFAYLRKLANAADRDVREAGDAVEEAQLHHVEAEEARERRARRAARRSRARRARAAPPPAASCSGSASRCRRRAIRPTRAADRREGARRTVDDHVLVHRVVGPARAPPVEQAHVPVGIALAMREPAAEKAVAARECERGGRGAAASARESRAELRRHALVGVEAQHPIVRRVRHREFFCGPKPSHACSITRAPQRRAISTVSSPLPESTTTLRRRTAPTRGTPRARPAASRVITQRLRGSWPACA